jgi:ferrous iron transport protein B
MLGVPCIPVSARKRTGIQTLMHAACHHQGGGTDAIIHDHRNTASASRQPVKHKRYAMVYSEDIERRIDRIATEVKYRYPQVSNQRWVAIKLLEQDKEITETYPVDLPDVLDRSYETDIINQKYDFIEEIIAEVLFNKASKEALTDKVDQVLTDKWLGLPVFLCIMALVFILTYTVGDWLKSYFEVFLEWFSMLVQQGLEVLHVAPLLTSLIVDGIIAGVGGILTFLPNIFVLFLALAFLEDSGYMARVAYIMDGIMGKLGLSGRAFLPMVLGFGCSVPAIMASRALEHRKDRLKTMLVTPFMSCSARLPIYILFASLFFPENKMLVTFSMYLIGIAVALLVAFVLHKIDGVEEENGLLIELPEYKAPSARTVFIYVWEKVKDYLTKAGTTIFIASIIMWFILNIGPNGLAADMTESFGAVIGKWLVPFFVPIGLGFWQIAVALIAGISAKEVVVSSTAVLYGIGTINSASGMAELQTLMTGQGFGALNAFCLMVFCLLYVPCAATIATIHRESGSWKWTAFSMAFQVAVAWVVTFVVYHLGLLIV